MKKAIIALVALSVAFFIGQYFWNAEGPNINDQKVDFTLTAADLATEFAADGKAADAKYLEKVLALSGTVNKVIDKDSLVSVVFSANDFEVTCELLPDANEKGRALQEGANTTVKAFYIGFMEADADFGIPGDIKFKKGVFAE